MRQFESMNVFDSKLSQALKNLEELSHGAVRSDHYLARQTAAALQVMIVKNSECAKFDHSKLVEQFFMHCQKIVENDQLFKRTNGRYVAEISKTDEDAHLRAIENMLSLHRLRWEILKNIQNFHRQKIETSSEIELSSLIECENFNLKFYVQQGDCEDQLKERILRLLEIPVNILEKKHYLIQRLPMFYNELACSHWTLKIPDLKNMLDEHSNGDFRVDFWRMIAKIQDALRTAAGETDQDKLFILHKDLSWRFYIHYSSFEIEKKNLAIRFYPEYNRQMEERRVTDNFDRVSRVRELQRQYRHQRTAEIEFRNYRGCSLWPLLALSPFAALMALDD